MLRRAIIWLVIAAVTLPVSIAIVIGAARLLAGMQDATAATVLDRLALGLGILWAINLVALLIVLGIQSADAHDRE